MAYHHPYPHRKAVDPRDRVISNLRAQLKAEQETRDTLIWAIRNGVTAPEVLEAIADDPVPAIESDEDALIRGFASRPQKPRTVPDKLHLATIQRLRG